MAMIKCTECGKELSDKAAVCPNCGCPIEQILSATAELEEQKEHKKAEKLEKAKAREEKRKSIPPEKKKKVTIISAVSLILIAIVAVLVWYFAIKVPRDEAFVAYTNSVETYNTTITEYNSAVSEYNAVAQSIISANDDFNEIIDEAQAVIDCGETPYEGDKLTTLSNTLKDARNKRVELPSLYENKESIVCDEALAKNKIDVIIAATDEINNNNNVVANEKDSILTNKDELAIPDYSATISKIASEKSELEDSYAITRQITNPSQDFVIQRLGNVENIANMAPVTEENDPNGKLNKAGGYTAQIYFSSPLLKTESLAGDALIDKGTDAGGSIEVYATVEDAESRNTYLASFDDSVFDSGKHVVLGTMVVRVSTDLPASKQETLTNEIIEALIQK